MSDVWMQKRWPSTLVIFITPPPIDEEARILHPYVQNPPGGLPERTNEAAGNYAQQCLAAAAECGAPAIDLWKKMQEFPCWKQDFLSDGLHLTEKGNQIVYDEVIGKLREANINLTTLQPDLPLFYDIDPNEPLKSFQI